MPSGTHVKLLAGSASSAVNHDLTGFISSTYHCYLVLLSKVTGLQGNTLDFQLILIMPTIATNFTGTFSKNLETKYNGKVMSSGELIEIF